MKFYVILLSLLVILSSITYADTIQDTLGTSTTDTGSNAIGAGIVYSAFNFTASSSYNLGKVEIYVSDYQGLVSPVNVGLYSINSTGGVGTQIGSNSSSVSSFSAGNRFNFTFTTTDTPIVSGGQYWLLFWASGSGQYIRVGDTAGSGKGIMASCVQPEKCSLNYAGGGNVVKTANIRTYESTTTSPNAFINYLSLVVSGEQQTIYVNITNTTLTQANATLNYNNTFYNMNLLFVNSTTAGFYYTFNTPIITSNSVIPFNVSYYLNDNFNTFGVGNNQIVYVIPQLIISKNPCSNMSYNFTFYDEDNQTILNMSTIDYNFQYGLGNSTLITTAGSISDSTNLYVCMNASISPTFNLGYSQINYQKTGWVARRWYGFTSTVISSTTKNVSLYDLNNVNAQAFAITVKSADGTIYANKYIQLIRWYPNLNLYAPVDEGITDSTGSSATYVRVTDTDYRVGVYEPNGTLVYMASPIRFLCLTSPCTYSLLINPNSVNYVNLASLQYSFTFNYTTNIWSFIYADSSQLLQAINLTVFMDTGSDYFPICSNTVIGSSGAVNCNTTLYAGWNTTMNGVVTRVAPTYIPITSMRITVSNNGIAGDSWGLFLSILLFIPIALVFAMISPVGAIIGGVIALLPALMLGSIDLVIFGAIIVISGVVMHMINKRVS